MKLLTREFFLSNILVAGGAIWFAFRQLPSTIWPLRFVFSSVVWAGTMVAVLFVFLLSRVLKAKRPGAVLLTAAGIALIALIAMGAFLPPDKRPYHFDPVPSGVPTPDP
jgi:hypothetical protein